MGTELFNGKSDALHRPSVSLWRQHWPVVGRHRTQRGEGFQPTSLIRAQLRPSRAATQEVDRGSQRVSKTNGWPVSCKYDSKELSVTAINKLLVFVKKFLRSNVNLTNISQLKTIFGMHAIRRSFFGILFFGFCYRRIFAIQRGSVMLRAQFDVNSYMKLNVSFWVVQYVTMPFQTPTLSEAPTVPFIKFFSDKILSYSFAQIVCKMNCEAAKQFEIKIEIYKVVLKKIQDTAKQLADLQKTEKDVRVKYQKLARTWRRKRGTCMSQWIFAKRLALQNRALKSLQFFFTYHRWALTVAFIHTRILAL